MDAIFSVVFEKNLFAGLGVFVVTVMLVWGGWTGVVGLVRYSAHGRKVDSLDVNERYLSLNDKWVDVMEERLSSLSIANSTLMTQLGEWQTRTAELERQLILSAQAQEQLGRQVSEAQSLARKAMDQCETLERRCSALERESTSRARLIITLEKQITGTSERLDRLLTERDELLTWVRENVPAQKIPKKWGIHNGRVITPQVAPG